MNSHAKWLRQAAEEIAKEGHAGWGNTCTQAADEIDRVTAEIEKAKRALLGEGGGSVALACLNRALPQRDSGQ